jgi:hypothetical protein
MSQPTVLMDDSLRSLCADLFRDGYTDVCQFTLVKNG